MAATLTKSTKLIIKDTPQEAIARSKAGDNLVRKTRDYFPKVRQAREALREKALDILETYIDTIKAAQAAGDYDVATKSLQWLMEHMPQEQEDRMLDVSIDKHGPADKRAVPAINIGFQIGGVKSEIIDVTDVTPKELKEPSD